MNKKVQTDYLTRLEYLENLLSKNCGNSKIGLFDFSCKIEKGWRKYQDRCSQTAAAPSEKDK